MGFSYDTWGASWGTSWLNSWGVGGTPTPSPAPARTGGGGYKPSDFKDGHKKRKYDPEIVFEPENIDVEKLRERAALKEQIISVYNKLHGIEDAIIPENIEEINQIIEPFAGSPEPEEKTILFSPSTIDFDALSAFSERALKIIKIYEDILDDEESYFLLMDH